MNRLRRVVNNTLISLVGQAITWSSTLLLTIAYGRFLGDVKFGELYFAITFVGLIGFPIEFGFNQQITRDVALDTSKAQRYLSSTLLVKTLLWCTFYVCMLFIAWHLNYSPEVRTLVAICGLTLLSGSITNTFISLHYAFERVIYPVIGTILEKGLAALIGFLLLKSGSNVEVMALVLLGGSAANATWQAFTFFRRVGFDFTIDWHLTRGLIRTSIPFLTYGVLGVIYYRLDTVLLSFMTNDAVIGWYGGAYRLFDTLVFLPGLVISAIMYPVFSKLSVSSETDLKVAIEKSLNFLLFCGLPIATAMIVAAPNIIGFLYHRTDFINSIPALQALAPGLVFLYINSVLTAILISTGHEKKITIMAAAALVFNLGLNLLLIPRYLHVGAAIVTSLTELLLTGIAVLVLPRRLIPFGSLRVGTKALIASLIMAVAIVILHIWNVTNIFFILTVAAPVYLLAATLLGTIAREDLQSLYTAVQRKANRVSTHAFIGQDEEEQALPPADEYLNMEEQALPLADETLYDEEEQLVGSEGGQ
ncbi:MAG: flippase [Ktedonobacteraceae bacterium]